MKLFIVPKGTKIKVHDLNMVRRNQRPPYMGKITEKEFVFEIEDVIADPIKLGNGVSIPTWTLDFAKDSYVVKLPDNNRGFDYAIIPFSSVEVM